MPPQRLLGVLLVVLAFVPALFADEVKLKSGRSVKGLLVTADDRIVKIETADGKTENFKRDDVESVSESSEIGNDEIDAKLKEIDTESATALGETAKWAKEKGLKGWRLVAKMALKRDNTNDTAHEALEHFKVGDKWFTAKADADKARREELAKEYQEKGYVRYKDGWIKKEEKAQADKNPGAFAKDDNSLYRDAAEIKREQGFTLLNGKWVKGGTPEDRADMAKFKELIHDDIWVTTTPHFRLFMQQYPPDKVEEFGQLLEKCYDWFVKEMKKEPGYQVFRGNKGLIWCLKDKNTVLDWFKNYRNKYSLGDGFQKLLQQGGGNVTSDHNLVATIVPQQNSDIRNQVAHVAGHYLIRAFCRGLSDTPNWLVEGFGHMAEHVQLGNGIINCSTLATYAADGGKAEKKFTTKDAHDRAKGLVREGGDEVFENLNKLDLNSLNGDHLTKGWTLIEWLMKEHHDQFVAWLEGMNIAEVNEALAKAIDGWGPSRLDDEWRKYVKKTF